MGFTSELVGVASANQSALVQLRNIELTLGNSNIVISKRAFNLLQFTFVFALLLLLYLLIDLTEWENLLATFIEVIVVAILYALGSWYLRRSTIVSGISESIFGGMKEDEK